MHPAAPLFPLLAALRPLLAGLLLVGLAAAAAPTARAADPAPPAPAARPAADVPQPPYCSVQRGSVHCHRKPGFEVHSFWDRAVFTHSSAGAARHHGVYGTDRPPWPLSNVLVDVER